MDEANSSVVHYDEREEDSDVASRLRVDVEASLRRLQTDYIDLYFLRLGYEA